MPKQVLRVLRFCRRISPAILTGGLLFGAKPVIFDNSQSQTCPLSSDLSHKTLIKNASSVAVDTICSLLHQTAIALAEAEQDYAKRIEAVVESVERACEALGRYDEAEAWDRLLEARSGLDEAKRERQYLQLLLTSVQQAVESVAVTAIQAESDYAGIIAGERLVSVKNYLKPFQERSTMLEETLSTAEIKSIELTSQHYEKMKKDSESTTHGQDHERVGDYDKDEEST